MRERIEAWFGPVLDADGRRVRWRISRLALILMVAAMMFGVATAVLTVLMATGMFTAPLWGATILAAWALLIAANIRLRRAVESPDAREVLGR